MISYSTEFPICSDSTTEEVLALACDWIAGSPHSEIKKESLEKITKTSEAMISVGQETITSGYASLPDFDIGGFRYTRIEDDNIEWTTTIVASQTPSEHLVSIQVSCEALRTASHLPHPKKPHFLKLVMEKIGGGMDGQIPVSDKPIRLESGEEKVAAQLLSGNAKNHLPIVYISSGFDGSHIINPDTLSFWLSGMAHVIVEPNREFSLLLKDLTRSRNVYGGTVGVYWPDSTARKAYYLTGEDSAKQVQSEIARDIRVALANRRQRTHCTWLHLKECISKSRYEQLKASGSTAVEEFIQAFDADMAAKQEKLDEAEREISRLNAEIRRTSAERSGREEGLLCYGDEQDLYTNEIKCFVLDALSSYLSNALDGTRRKHVLTDLIQHNEANGEADKIREEIKALFKSYVAMDAKMKQALAKLGFDISEDGKHYKIVFQGDGRYTFSVSKTSSDHRAGKNQASDINKQLF